MPKTGVATYLLPCPEITRTDMGRSAYTTGVIHFIYLVFIKPLDTMSRASKSRELTWFNIF